MDRGHTPAVCTRRAAAADNDDDAPPQVACQQILASERRWRARLGTVECEEDLVMQSFEGDKKQKKDKKRDDQNQKKKKKNSEKKIRCAI